MTFIEQGIKAGIISIEQDGRFIVYQSTRKKYRFSDPEEQVRAELYAQLVLEYGYPLKRIDVEVTVPRRTPADSADIVVFSDDDRLKPYIVAECKKQKISEAEFTQSIEQGFGNANSLKASFLLVTSGIKTNAYDVEHFPSLERVKNLIADIPRFGKSKISKAKFYKGGVDENGGKAKDIRTVDQNDLTGIFEQAHQALWAGGKRNPSEAFDELDKLIFCKIWDERKVRKNGQPYDFQEYTGEQPEVLLLRIQAIYQQGRDKDPEVFRDPIRLSAGELRTIVGYLAELNLHATDLDSKGRAFETFLGSFFRGDFGQYFTPREVVDFIVRVLPIGNESMVLDTSCGSGGFLLYALDKVRKQADQKADEGYFKKDSIQHREYWHEFAQRRLFGIEISEGIARTAKMNMIIHDDGHTNVVTADGLLSAEYKPSHYSETKEEIESREKWNANTIQGKSNNHHFKYNHFDFIITNPPFGSTIRQTEQAYLKYYGLGIKEINWIDRRLRNKFVLGTRESQSTEVLFIEQCHRYLKPGGMLAIVVPDGILTNSSLQYVRDWIEDHYRVISVVSLPQSAFMSNGAGVKSSVLFLMKLPDKETQRIQLAKEKIQEKLFRQPRYGAEIRRLEEEKKRIIKEHDGFDYATVDWEVAENRVGLEGAPPPAKPKEIPKKIYEGTVEFRAWRNEITQNYTEAINSIRDSMQEEYLQSLAEEINHYPIMMVIAENIGYDAAGRKTGKNELEKIAPNLSEFITSVYTDTEPFFA